MLTATWFRADGSEKIVHPANGTHFTYEELRAFVGGMVEHVDMPDGSEFWLNEEGKLDGLPKNEKATAIWKKAYPIEQYPDNNDELVVGDVLFLDAVNAAENSKQAEAA